METKTRLKKNENETYNMIEIPVDDTIEEKEKEIHRSLLKFVTSKMDKLQYYSKIITSEMELMHQGDR